MLLRLLLPWHTINQMSMIQETFIPNRIEQNLLAEVIFMVIAKVGNIK